MGKREYRKPALRKHGDALALTRGSKTGIFLDASFPTGTPFNQLTFSN